MFLASKALSYLSIFLGTLWWHNLPVAISLLQCVLLRPQSCSTFWFGYFRFWLSELFPTWRVPLPCAPLALPNFFFFFNLFPLTPGQKSLLKFSTALYPGLFFATTVRLLPLYRPPSAFEVFLRSAAKSLASTALACWSTSSHPLWPHVLSTATLPLRCAPLPNYSPEINRCTFDDNETLKSQNFHTSVLHNPAPCFCRFSTMFKVIKIWTLTPI